MVKTVSFNEVFTATCAMEDWKVEFPPRRHLPTHLRADYSEQTKVVPGRYPGQETGLEPRRRVPRGGAVVMETRTLPAPDCNSQRPPRLPVGKMVARRRKRGSRDPEQGIPSPPGYSGEGPRGRGGQASPGGGLGCGAGSGTPARLGMRPGGPEAPKTLCSRLAALFRDEPVWATASLG